MKTIKKQVNVLKTRNVIPLLLLALALLFTFCVNDVSAATGDIYVNASSGNDAWDGLSAVHTSGTNGPKATITNGTGAVLSGGTIYIANGTYNENNINLTKNMNIVGESQKNTIINGDSAGTIFYVKPGVTVTIMNLTLTNGKTTGMGGAIQGDTTLSYSIDYNGGAINNQGTLTVKNCDFTNNYANNNGAGGAIYNYGTLAVTGSTFSGNIATMGGAIYNLGTATVNFSRMAGNGAYQGDSIYLVSGTVNANYNWWGSNTGPSGIVGTVTADKWIISTVTANPTTVNNGENPTIAVNFNHINGGGSLMGGCIPDGTPVTFSLNSPIYGEFSESTAPVTVLTHSGTATIVFTSTSIGTQTITVQTDDQSATTQITINKVSTTLTVDPASGYNGSSTTLRATLKLGSTNISGKVIKFYINGVNVGSGTTGTDGVATCTYNPITQGRGVYTGMITAVFEGDAQYITSNGANTLTVLNVVPAVPNYNMGTDEDTSISGTVAGTDADGDALAYSKGTNPAHGTATVNGNGSYTYMPYSNWNGTDRFTVNVNDGHGGTATSTVTIIVTPVNDVPVAVDDTAVTDEDTQLTDGNVAGNDAPSGDGGNVWSVVSGPDHGILVMNGDGSYTYTPYANYNGPDQFTYQIKDVDGDNSTATMAITVNPVNDAPTVGNYDVNTQEDTSTSGTVVGNDIDSTVTYAVTKNPSHGIITSFNPDSGAWTYLPYEDYNGDDSFGVTVSDGLATALSKVTIRVTPVNDVPVVNDESKTTDEDTSVSGSITGSDVDGDSLNYVKVTDPSHGTVTVNGDGTYIYTPNSNWFGTDSFTVSVNDGHGGSDTATVTITVDPVNDVPVTNDDSATVDEDGSLSGNVSANDTPSADGGNVWSKSIDPVHGTATVNRDGSYTYTPDANYNGTDSFEYMITDVDGSTSTATVYITVNPVNDAPIANNDSVTTKKDTTVNVDVISNDSDVDGDSLTVTGVGDPAHGTAVINGDGTVSYTPYAGYYGLDQFSYIIGDGNGEISTGTVNITVNQTVANVYVLTTVSKNNPAVGETITLTFKLGNNGPDTANDVVFMYVVPEGMEFVSLDSESGYPEPVYDPATRTITWNLGNLPEVDPWLKVNLKVLKEGNFNINPAVTTSTYDPTLESSVKGTTLNTVGVIDTSNQSTDEKTTVNAASKTTKTIGMQDTGLPLNYLILAVLMVIGGLVPKKK